MIDRKEIINILLKYCDPDGPVLGHHAQSVARRLQNGEPISTNDTASETKAEKCAPQDAVQAPRNDVLVAPPEGMDLWPLWLQPGGLIRVCCPDEWSPNLLDPESVKHQRRFRGWSKLRKVAMMSQEDEANVVVGSGPPMCLSRESDYWVQDEGAWSLKPADFAVMEKK